MNIVAPAASGKTQILTIGTADSTGTMYPVGAAVASVINDNVPGFKVNVETSKGSPANCVNIQSGEVQLATIAGDTAMQAVNGMGKFEGQACEDLRAICAVYTSLSNWIALKESGLTMVNELGGKNVAVGPEASTTEIAGLAGLAAAGLKPVVAVYSSFLGYTDEELDNVIAENPSYYKTVIPAGTYPGQDEDVPTFGVKCLIVANANLPEEDAYAFAEALSTHVSDLVAGHASMSSMEDPSFICNDIPIELHPGAKKYYEEAGMLK